MQCCGAGTKSESSWLWQRSKPPQADVCAIRNDFGRNKNDPTQTRELPFCQETQTRLQPRSSLPRSQNQRERLARLFAQYAPLNRSPQLDVELSWEYFRACANL